VREANSIEVRLKQAVSLPEALATGFDEFEVIPDGRPATAKTGYRACSPHP
jgi:hypothetical protein